MLAVGVVFVARGDFLRFLRTVRFFEDFVFKRQILTVAAGVALSTAASDELAVDARGESTQDEKRRSDSEKALLLTVGNNGAPPRSRR